MSLSVAEQIQQTLASSNKQAASLQHLFNLDGVNVHQDLKTMLAVASRDGLRRLQAAFQNNRVIRQAYCDDRSGGCLVFHLFGVTNSEELVELDLPSVETGFAMYRTIQAWDHGRLSREVVEHFLEQELATRETRPDDSPANRKECVSA